MLKAAALTDIGRKRQVNQDYVYASVEPVGALPNLFILADGMGGRRAGDFAARFLIHNFVAFFKKTKEYRLPDVLKNALTMTNSLLLERSRTEDELRGMGTTAVAAVIVENRLSVANVGDSRLYLIRNGITQVTRDHSYVEELAEDGLLQRGSEEYLSKKNLITRAVGVESRVEGDFFETDLEHGDYILICSDGLTNMIDNDMILTIVSGHGGLVYKARTLIDAANEKGGDDNIAVILVRYEKDGEPDA